MEGSAGLGISPEDLDFSSPLIVKVVVKGRAWSARNRWRLNGCDLERLLGPNTVDARGTTGGERRSPLQTSTRVRDVCWDIKGKR